MQLYGKDFKVIEVLGGLTEGKKHRKFMGIITTYLILKKKN